MNVFDQASRFAAKLDPAGFVRWLVAGLPGDIRFEGWLDTRTIPLPGEPDRTCDTVAELADPRVPDERWALVLEFQTEPRGELLDRLLEYVARLRRELRHGAARSRKYLVAAAMVNLTGPDQPAELTMALPGGAAGLTLRVVSRAMREVAAGPLLAEMAAGRLSRGLLPWVSLMDGGGQAAIMESWKRQASAEADPIARSTYGALALVFAELTGRRPQWEAALEGWDMLESTVVAGWKAEGKIEAQRAALMRLIELRFPDQVSADLRGTIEGQSDADKLSRWFDAAVTAPTPEALRAAVQG